MEEIVTLTQRKRSQIHQSVDIPFYLTIEGYEYNKELGTFLYKIEYGKQVSQSQILRKNIYKRYSEILNFYNELSMISELIDINDFLEKFWFFKNNENKIKRRCERMSVCLSRVCCIENITKNDVFKKFVDEK